MGKTTNLTQEIKQPTVAMSFGVSNEKHLIAVTNYFINQERIGASTKQSEGECGEHLWVEKFQRYFYCAGTVPACVHSQPCPVLNN